MPSPSKQYIVEEYVKWRGNKAKGYSAQTFSEKYFDKYKDLFSDIKAMVGYINKRVKNVKEYGAVTTNSDSSGTENDYTEKRNSDGTVEITEVVGKKLSNEEIFDRYGRSSEEWRIVTVWFKDKGGRIFLSVNFAPLKGKEEIKQDTFKLDLIEAIRQIKPIHTATKYTPIKNGCMLEVDIFDPHFGKLAWGKETGENYDLPIAEERYQNAIVDLINKTQNYNIEKILFPIGNDQLHYDTIHQTTTAGTPQDSDVRWQKMFIQTRIAIMKAISTLRQVAPVDVVRVNANHDFQTMFYMGDLLETYYEDDKYVTVNNSPKARKYYKYGKVGIGFTHGDQEKHADLPLIMLREQQKEWSDVEFMEWHLGHFHKSKTIKFTESDEYNGIMVRFLRSLSATDAWHNMRGYSKGLKSAEAFVWDKENGLIGNYYSTIQPSKL